MASFNPFFSPKYGEKPWVDQIGENLKTQLAVTIDAPPVSIFEIPNNIKAEKLEAYVPQRTGLGLNHHFKPELYHKTEQKKLTAVKRVLKPHQIQDFEQDIVAKVKRIIPVIRACYDVYHDADDDMLAWLFTIDGMFLIDQLNACSNHGFVMEANELIMLENQIPLMVLNEIEKALSTRNATKDQESLESKFRYFCKSHSSFHLSEEHVDYNRVNHLLDYMYNSIVRNETMIPKPVHYINHESDADEAKEELLEAVIKFAGVIPGAEPLHQVIEFVMEKFPDITEGKTTMAEEILVPTVSELKKMAGVEFRLSPENEGIRNINFVQGKVRYCYLPKITLNSHSEVVLRNLVAYERLIAMNSYTGGYGLELTEYVDFMCGIIDTVKDVQLLREQNIIDGDLSDEEVVKLFNGIGKSRVEMNVESELSRTVGQMNMVYESKPSVWVEKMVKKQAKASAKFVLVLIIISGTLLLFREVYLMVYDSDAIHMRLVHFLRARFNSFIMFFRRPKGPTVSDNV